MQELVDLHKEYNQINERFAEPMSDEDMNKLIERQGEVQEKIDTLGAWDLDARLEMAMDALRCPEGNVPVKVLSGGERRRVALCRLLLKSRTFYFWMNRRIILTPDRCLAGAPFTGL